MCGFSSTSLHDRRERVPFDLGERQEDVLVGQKRVLAAAGLFDRPVHDALRGFADLAR